MKGQRAERIGQRGQGMMARARQQNPPAGHSLLRPLVPRPSSREAVCIGCGCSDSHACVTAITLDDFASSLQGCWWVKVDHELGVGICSECPEMVESFEDWLNRLKEQTA